VAGDEVEVHAEEDDEDVDVLDEVEDELVD
jgi:hypothetical protein